METKEDSWVVDLMRIKFVAVTEQTIAVSFADQTQTYTSIIFLRELCGTFLLHFGSNPQRSLDNIRCYWKINKNKQDMTVCLSVAAPKDKVILVRVQYR